MKHIVKRVIVLIVASAASVVAQSDPPNRVGRLNYIEGLVSFQPAGVSDWVDASVNRPLIPGDNIWVGDRARAELHVGSTALRLGPNTAFEFLSLDDDVVQIRLSEGTLSARVRNLSQNQVIEVDTPNLAFTVLRPGEYRIDANPDAQATTLTVRSGEGEVTGGGEIFPIQSRQQAVVRGDDRISYNFANAPGADPWDQWTSSRDRREDQSQSASYVSREMTGYEDLDRYGSWSIQADYGEVWMPTTVAAGWAPYHSGYWAWVAPWGWTWVDDAPWGFAPYHYGRWASFGNRWGWIPGPRDVAPVYAPALVAWVGGGPGGSGFSLSFSIGTAAAVGWFPLGPREPYFPSYQASQGYFTRVNTANTVITTTTINNYYNYSRNSNHAAVTNIRYANERVQNGVMAVPQDAFAKGRQVNQAGRAVSAAQLGSAQVYGSPAIAPQREGVLGAKGGSNRGGRPPDKAISRPVVARRTPAPAPVPFDRQQSALASNAGRALPAATEQQLRQGAPVSTPPARVVDMNRVRRVQPTVVDGQKGKGALPNTPASPAQQQPPSRDRQKGNSNQQPQAQPQAPQTSAPPAQQQPPSRDRQKGNSNPQPQAQPQAPQTSAPPAQQQPPSRDRQKGNSNQQPQAQPQPPQTSAPPAQQQPPSRDRQKGNANQQPQAQPQAPQTSAPPAQQPPSRDRQKGNSNQQPQAQPQAPQTSAPPAQQQPPSRDRQKGTSKQPGPQAPQTQDKAAPPSAPDRQKGNSKAQPQPQAEQPQAETPQPAASPKSKDNGKQKPAREDKGDK